jgi:FSR family fosmidomycin resistance protein-like MFS transporter
MSVAATLPAPAHEATTDRAGLRLLTLAHLMNDMNQGVLPAMIPWLVLHRHLSLELAATLILAANLFGSVVQPLFGYLSDKRATAWVVPVAMLVATLGTATIGFAPTLPLMLLGAVLSGFGVAAFHPEASRLASYFAGAKRASGMSFFTFGGYLGLAAGPVVATPLILAFRLPGVALLLIPASVVATLLVRELPRLAIVRRLAHRAHRERAGADDWRAFSIMGLVVALRSTMFLAAASFTPIFVMRVTGVDAGLGSVALFTLLAGGAAGTMLGGRLADRFDRRHVITLSLGLSALFGAALALTGAHAGNYLAITILALGLGVALGLSAGVLVVLGQEYLPKHIGIASGVTLGLANTIGGLAAPAFGKIGDNYGLVTVFVAIAVSGTLALAASFLMPRPASDVGDLRSASPLPQTPG